MMLIFRPSETDDRKDVQPFSKDGINSYLIEGRPGTLALVGEDISGQTCAGLIDVKDGQRGFC